MRLTEKAAALVPSPAGAVELQVTLQMETATLGIVLLPALCTTITRWLVWASRWLEGKLAVAIETGKFPLGSLAAWFEPEPHAATAREMPTPARIPRLLRLQALKAG